MIAIDLPTLHALTDLLTTLSCVSLCAALGWYLMAIRGRNGGLTGATVLVCVFVIALAATRIVRYVTFDGQSGATLLYPVEALATAVTVLVAVLVWFQVPRLLTLPTRSELVAINRRLLDEQAARQALVVELQGLNDELERRVDERTQQLETAKRRFEIALEGSNIAVAQQDRDLRYVWIWNPPSALAGIDVVGRLPEDVLPPETARRQAEVKTRVLDTGVAERFEVSFPNRGRMTWFEGRVEPLVVEGRMEGVVTVSIDITRHKDHEREIRDILRELTHRSKNLLAVVQGIARQSMIGAEDLPHFIDAFNGRLQALSWAHELLVEQGWRGVGLRAVIERGLADLSTERWRIALAGEDVVLTPEAAQNFALAIHELTGNLPIDPSNRFDLVVQWQIDPGRRLVFEWVPDTHGDTEALAVGGFGRIFLQHVLPRSLDGAAELHPDHGSASYRLTAPVDRVLVST